MQEDSGKAVKCGISVNREQLVVSRSKGRRFKAGRFKGLRLKSVKLRSETLGGDGRNPMSQVPVWFERKFAFSFPVEVWPNVCARLRGTPARLEEALRGRAHDMLTRKSEGKWSAQEHAGHLLDLEPLWLARVDDYVAGSEQLSVADLRNRKTDEANYSARPLEQILAEFRVARERLLKRVEELDPSLFDRAIVHPRLKTPMRLVDHLYFVAEHDDHHLARMWELVNCVENRGAGIDRRGGVSKEGWRIQ